MKSLIPLLMTATIIVASCNNGSKDTKASAAPPEEAPREQLIQSTAGPQSDPKALAEAIFNAAKNGSYEGLPALIADDADGDSKRIAAAAADPATAQQFQQYFSKGKVNGEPVINGDKASVNILFGPDGTKEESFEMVQKDGKWYLQSF